MNGELCCSYRIVLLKPEFIYTAFKNSLLIQQNKIHFHLFLWRNSATRFRVTSFLRYLNHITLGRTPLDEGSARRKDLYLTAHNIQKRQTSTPPDGNRIRNPIKRSPADPRLRPLCHWDRSVHLHYKLNSLILLRKQLLFIVVIIRNT